MNLSPWLAALLAAGAALTLAACPSIDPTKLDPSGSKSSVAGYEQATEAMLRAIPKSYVAAARSDLHVAYQHTSHGTHVSYGLYGLQAYTSGDDALFGVSTGGESGKLDWQDNKIPSSYHDLTEASGNWSTWISNIEAYLDDSDNAAINVMMWSWCDISNKDVAGYISSMQTLIDEYGPGGTKIGNGTGQRLESVTFIFMTGHAYTDNVGDKKPKNQADLITAYCKEHNYYCLDYYSIDSHDMDGNYYSDASDDAYSSSYGGNYNQVWQAAHAEGQDWFYNQAWPGGTSTTVYGDHLSQHITSNRKAYAMWYILAHIAGWSGS